MEARTASPGDHVEAKRWAEEALIPIVDATERALSMVLPESAVSLADGILYAVGCYFLVWGIPLPPSELSIALAGSVMKWCLVALEEE